MSCALRYLELDWAKEPFTGGCPVGSANAGVIALWGDTIRSAHARVSFAGTETATWWPGYMSGALQAGARSAIEVLMAEGQNVPQELIDFEKMGPDTPNMLP
jgi:monoamine oxidase